MCSASVQLKEQGTENVESLSKKCSVSRSQYLRKVMQEDGDKGKGH